MKLQWHQLDARIASILGSRDGEGDAPDGFRLREDVLLLHLDGCLLRHEVCGHVLGAHKGDLRGSCDLWAPVTGDASQGLLLISRLENMQALTGHPDQVMPYFCFVCCGFCSKLALNQKLSRAAFSSQEV